MEQYLTDAGQVLRVHDRDQCVGAFCVIHRPMPGPWDTWPTLWRSDTGIMERMCPCGTGHPVAESYEYLPWYRTVHGCCGCPCTSREGRDG
jgi:hypothetical protein